MTESEFRIAKQNKEFKCGTYREWDSLDKLIKALRDGDVLRSSGLRSAFNQKGQP